MTNKYDKLYNLVINSPVNITAIKDRTEFFNKHILDSIRYFELNLLCGVKSVADIGSGGGFPGIPIAILRPDWQISLVESIGKKCAFMKSCIEALALNNALVINSRAEKVAASYDIIVSRGVAAVLKLLKLTKHLAHENSFWLLYKGAKLQDELAEATPYMIKEGLSFEITRIDEPFTRSYLKIYKREM